MQGQTSRSSEQMVSSKFDPLLREEGKKAYDISIELFTIVTLLDTYPRLERVLTDPSRNQSDKNRVIETLIGGQAHDLTQAILCDLSSRNWSKITHIADAAEHMAVKALAYYTDAINQTAQVASELAQIYSALIGQPIVLFRLSDEYIESDKRVALFAELFANKNLLPATMQLAEYATRDLRGRSYLTTLEWLIGRFSEHMNESLVTVVTAVPLETQQKERIADTYSKKLGQAVFVNSIVNPEVIGGMRVEYGSEVTDCTVSAQLQKLRQEVATSS